MEAPLVFFGKYGERFESIEVEGGQRVCCAEIGMKNKLLTSEEASALERAYCDEGVPDFDKSDRDMLHSRAKNLGFCLQRTYFYLGLPDKLSMVQNAFRIRSLLLAAETLGLGEEEYMDHLILQGAKGVIKPDEEYIAFVLALRKRIKDFQ